MPMPTTSPAVMARVSNRSRVSSTSRGSPCDDGVADARTYSHRGVITPMPNETWLGLMRYVVIALQISICPANRQSFGSKLNKKKMVGNAPERVHWKETENSDSRNADQQAAIVCGFPDGQSRKRARGCDGRSKGTLTRALRGTPGARQPRLFRSR